MDSQRFDPAIKQPSPLNAHFPPALLLDENDHEFVSRYPSPPPPTPCIPRRGTPLDAQRFDPFKNMLAATSPPRYPSPDPKDPDAYPALADSVAFPLPPRDAYDDLLTYHLGEHDFVSSDDLTSDSEDTTPTDESGGPPPGRSTTYRLTGASEEGDFTIERTIIRPVPRRSFRADLTRSLTSLAMRSTTTLRAVPSISQLSGATTPSSPEDADEDEDEDGDGIVAPPASTVASRRPSLAVAEVTEGLKRLASRLALRTPQEQAVDRGHFEESVDHFEETWARTERGEPPVEVFFKRTREWAEEDGDASEFYDEPRADFGLGRRGVGIYP